MRLNELINTGLGVNGNFTPRYIVSVTEKPERQVVVIKSLEYGFRPDLLLGEPEPDFGELSVRLKIGNEPDPRGTTESDTEFDEDWAQLIDNVGKSWNQHEKTGMTLKVRKSRLQSHPEILNLIGKPKEALETILHHLITYSPDYVALPTEIWDGVNERHIFHASYADRELPDFLASGDGGKLVIGYVVEVNDEYIKLRYKTNGKDIETTLPSNSLRAGKDHVFLAYKPQLSLQDLTIKTEIDGAKSTGKSLPHFDFRTNKPIHPVVLFLPHGLEKPAEIYDYRGQLVFSNYKK